ncbi:hypothetical protein B0H66DRAFT_561689 [Apodospora peruviana]|uniref:Uncharacterized protein n=1 Tax=Apodospora peruviana TaxID=516989 RepID=A0AAE0M2C8_9PEZI|nr:hypothetical protein B0H66DRAFT_561689 [Apodospora peruviana]
MSSYMSTIWGSAPSLWNWGALTNAAVPGTMATNTATRKRACPATFAFPEPKRLHLDNASIRPIRRMRQGLYPKPSFVSTSSPSAISLVAGKKRRVPNDFELPDAKRTSAKLEAIEKEMALAKLKAIEKQRAHARRNQFGPVRRAKTRHERRQSMQESISEEDDDEVLVFPAG